MKSIDEAIEHALEVADKADKDMDSGYYDEELCEKCRDEHRQLADWLKELKWWRSCQHACETCKYGTKSIYDEPCASCMEPPVKNDKRECGYEGEEY